MNPNYRVECVVQSCSLIKVTTIQDLVVAGWRMLCKSEYRNRGRQWIGWCPTCARKYGVTKVFHEQSR